MSAKRVGEPAAGRWRLRLELDEPDSRVAAAVDETGTIIGLAAAGATRDQDAPTAWELYSINVVADLQGSGLAGDLIRAAVGDRDVSLWVLANNTRAQRFYDRQGFSIDGATRADEVTGSSEIRMVRRSRADGPEPPTANLSAVAKPLAIPFDPIRRAADLWRSRWGARSGPVAMAAATSIMRVQRLLLGDFDATVGRHGLTFARYEALVLLAFSSEGRLPMSKIGQRLMVHPTSVTNIIQRLAAQGLVERAPNPADGRGMLATITPRGREVMEAATTDLVATGFSLGALTEAEHEQLFALLRKVRKAAGDFSG